MTPGDCRALARVCAELLDDEPSASGSEPLPPATCDAGSRRRRALTSIQSLYEAVRVSR